MLNINYNTIILKMRFEVNHNLLESDVFMFSYPEDKDRMLYFISSLQMILFQNNTGLVLMEI
jgi:hypothetical protein